MDRKAGNPGIDAPEGAYDVATQTILDMVNDPAALRDLTDWVIEIRDENEQTLLTIPFSEATHVSGSGWA
jgi:hypothetical protein